MNGPDPFAVDEARWLEALEREWGRAYLIKINGGRWYAAPIDGSGDALTAATPGELHAMIHRSAW